MYCEVPVQIHVASLGTDGPEGQLRDDPLGVDSLSKGDRLLLMESLASSVGPVIRRLVAANEDTPGVVLISNRKLLPDSLSTAVDPMASSDGQTPHIGGQSNGSRGRQSTGEIDRRVSFSSPLTGVEMAVTQRLADLRRGGVERPWLVVDTLSPLFGTMDSKVMVRFLHSLSSTVEHYGGIGCYVANRVESRNGHLERLEHLSDGVLDVRRTGPGREVRRRGFGESDAEWRSIEGADHDSSVGRVYPEAE